MGLEIYMISFQALPLYVASTSLFGTGIILDMYLISQADMSRYTKATANT